MDWVLIIVFTITGALVGYKWMDKTFSSRLMFVVTCFFFVMTGVFYGLFHSMSVWSPKEFIMQLVAWIGLFTLGILAGFFFAVAREVLGVIAFMVELRFHRHNRH